jgi:hypothetical protein
MYGHTDTDTVGNFHIRIRLYGVSRYAVFSYIRFWPTLHMCYITTLRLQLRPYTLNAPQWPACSVCVQRPPLPLSSHYSLETPQHHKRQAVWMRRVSTMCCR